MNGSNRFRVLRGGSWLYYVINARCSVRGNNLPDYWIDYVGFRLVKGAK